MPFFLDGEPTPSELSESINYLLSNFTQNVSADPATGQIIGPAGSVNGYLYKYMFVKYADSFDGTVNFSNSPTNRSYYGLRNSDSSTESTNPADYLWTKVTPAFGTTYFLYYLTSGGRTIQFQVATSVPNAGWIVDGGSAIDLDITNATNAVANFVIIRTPNNSTAPTNAEVVSAIGRTPISGDLATINYNSGLSSVQYKYTTGWTFFQKYITADIVQASVLSAFTANLGTVTAGELTIGSSPTISGTTMTGAGTHLYSDGRFAMGNSTANITFNGTVATLNGFTNAPQTTTASSNPFASTVTIATLTLSRTGTTLFCFDGLISITDSGTTSIPALRYVANGALNIDLVNSSNVILYTMQLSYGGASVLQSYVSGVVGRNAASIYRQPLAASYPISLTPDTYTIKATAGATRRDGSGVDIGPASGASSVNLYANVSLFQVAA